MFVVPSSFGVILHLFIEKGFMSFMPGLKQAGKSLLIHSPQIRSDSSQVNRGLQLRITGKVSGQDGLLMEMTHLLRNSLKDPEQSRFSIGHDRLDYKAEIFNLLFYQTVFKCALSLNKTIGDHRLAPGIFRNQDPEFISALPEERGIENQGNTSRISTGNQRFIGMNFPLNPGSGSLIFSREFLESAAVVEVLLEKYSAKSDTTTPGGKTGPTIKASILLNSSMMTIFLGVIGTTLGTLFYKPSVKKSFLSTILP